VGALSTANDTNTRWWAVRALAEIGGGAAAELLARSLADVDPDVRACAALALGQIARDLPEAQMNRVLLALAGRLADGSSFVASVASDALSMVGERSVEALATALTDERPHARLLAVRALARIGSPKAIDPLCGLLEDPSYLVQHHAQEALEALGVGLVLLAP
jgi:HEAT repeat protein